MLKNITINLIILGEIGIAYLSSEKNLHEAVHEQLQPSVFFFLLWCLLQASSLDLITALNKTKPVKVINAKHPLGS